MEQDFKNKICAFYPISKSDSLVPSIYFNVIHGHTRSNLILNVILGGMDLSKKYFTLDLSITRNDNKTIPNRHYKLDTTEMSKKGTIKKDNITVGIYTLGPIVFEIDDHSTFAYKASLVLKDDDGNICDSAHTWFLIRPDKDTNKNTDN